MCDSPVLLPRELPAGVRDATRVTRRSVAGSCRCQWWRSNAKERSGEALFAARQLHLAERGLTSSGESRYQGGGYRSSQ